MPEILKVIGERLRAYRKAQGLSQEELASKAQLHATYIGQVERGEKNASLETIQRVTEALGIPLATLFECYSADTDKPNYPLESYQMFLSLSQEKQKELLEIVRAIVDFQNK